MRRHIAQRYIDACSYNRTYKRDRDYFNPRSTRFGIHDVEIDVGYGISIFILPITYCPFWCVFIECANGTRVTKRATFFDTLPIVLALYKREIDNE